MSQWVGCRYCLYLSSPVNVAIQIHMFGDMNICALQEFCAKILHIFTMFVVEMKYDANICISDNYLHICMN